MTWTRIFEWHVVGYGFKYGHQKGHVFQRDWTECWKSASHSRLLVYMIWETLYDHL